ncbi:MAG TPA: hypothetical protein ENG40_02470 [Thermoprotei archaeon]|nr:hypothetical protein [Thermoprotei archaeon]
MADWYYWTNKISIYQSIAKKINNKYITRRIRKLCCKRKNRFRDKVNKIVKRFIDICLAKNVVEITCGNLNGIRSNCRRGNGSRKRNKIINNFWSHKYIVDRLKTTAENYGLKLTLVNEHNTSSYCPICGANSRRIYRGLFYCPRCSRYMNADVVGCLNIARKYGVKIPKNIKLHPKFIKILKKY